MPDRTQDLTNHRKVAVACKNYTDTEIKKSEERILSIVARNNVDFIDHTDEATYQITAPANAKLLMLQAIGGNTVKLSPSVASDSTKAMIKTMPSTVYTFDGSKFYGDSEVSENLITPNTFNNSVSTFSFENGVLTASNVDGSPYTYANAQFKLYLSAGSYRVKFFDTSLATSAEYNAILVDENGNQSDYGLKNALANSSGYSLTISTSGNYGFRIKMKGSTKMMLVAGTTTPTTFVKGFDGIHNIELTGIRSEGANLVDISNRTITSRGYLISKTIIDTLPIGTYTFSFDINVSGTCQLILQDANDNTSASPIINCSIGNNSITFTTTRISKYITLYANIEGGCSSSNFILNRGSTALDYVPYVAPTTKTIDLSTILYNDSPLFEGNSLKAVGTAKDYITPYTAIKCVGAVKIKDLEILYNSYYQVFYTYISGKKVGRLNLMIADFTTVDKPYNTLGNMEVGGSTVDTGVNIKDTSCVDISAFVTKYGEYIINYELETPIEVSIDLSATLRNIQGYSNGSITAQNTYNMDVESVITYNSIIQETLCPSITITRNGVDILTRNLPTQASDGYSAGTQRNYRVFCDDEGNEVLKRETNVDKLNSLNIGYSYNSQYDFFYANVTNNRNVYDVGSMPNILTNNYTTDVVGYDSTMGTRNNMTITNTRNNNIIQLKNTLYDNASDFNKSMNGLPLYYEFNDASKTESDMDDFDFFFDVEEGDVITFNNPYAQQVYATYSFLIKEAKSNE